MCFARQALKFTCSGFSHSFRIPAGSMTFFRAVTILATVLKKKKKGPVFYRFGRYDRYDRYIQSVGWRWVGGSEPRESRKGACWSLLRCAVMHGWAARRGDAESLNSLNSASRCLYGDALP